ncbi:pyridoxal phosphate-dependent aminotransferase [Macrococcus equipercicus]|uniref:Histidinol-phosphate aminotransferase family protein n=1 Tax=Macrococcus equipercicus TaxID=69967 RepID=A0A9Q9BW05_9STAP|nr:histidinol-phosphate transaminase [Macrococcus equipercicus]UTH13432.1 histidinol-phosphate aminotransferase family protein [Macrococcus equipercicus]
MIRINKNESPIRAFTDETLKEIVVNSRFFEYPDDEYDEFLEAYATYNGFDKNQLSAANGSDEWIQKCMIALGDGPVLTINPDFFMYTDYAAQLKRPIHYVNCEEDFSFDLTKILTAMDDLKPSFFILSQPNNPTGALFSDDFIQQCSDKMEALGGYFVLDEAYIEFSEPYSVPAGKHVIQMRTMSKIYGFAGLRIGIVITHPDTIALLNSIHHPYPINTLSLQLATHLLRDQPSLDEFFAYQRARAAQLQAIFLNQSDVINVIPSHTNFIMTYGENALSLGRYIESHGFLPRTYPDDALLKEVVRYSISTEENLNQLARIVTDWRSHYDSVNDQSLEIRDKVK